MKKFFAPCLLFLGQTARAEAMPAARSAFAVSGLALFIILLVALIAAFIAVSCMIAKLKTAGHQAHASHYIRENSFRLDVEEDRYLYQSVSRRRIETENDQNK